MSPLLLGLFVDSLEGELGAQLSVMGALPLVWRPPPLRPVLYADDLVLMEDTPYGVRSSIHPGRAACVLCVARTHCQCAEISGDGMALLMSS
jgi:hypothetical protein